MLSDWGSAETDVQLTLYTDSFVIRGTMTTRQRRLSDLLNLATDDFLVISDVDMQAIGGREEHHVAPFAQVNLAAVLFAVASETVAPAPELRMPKIKENTLISVPPFSITGQIHLMPESNLRAALEELQGRFIPITDATFWSSIVNEPPVTAPMLAVNHARAQILSPYGEALSGL
jgi:hypothetical protein